MGYNYYFESVFDDVVGGLLLGRNIDRKDKDASKESPV
jgi:hypothetical protein